MATSRNRWAGRSGRGMGARIACAALLVLGVGACAQSTPPAPVKAPQFTASRTSVSLIKPRCAGVQSCLLGHVTAAESARPLARAAVFLERMESSGAEHRILTLTDEDGVFSIKNPPPGHYRLAIYSESRRVEMSGMELGHAGTTMVPIRMALQ